MPSHAEHFLTRARPLLSALEYPLGR